MSSAAAAAGDKLCIPDQPAKVLRYLFSNQEEYADVALFGAAPAASDPASRQNLIQVEPTVVGARAFSLRQKIACSFVKCACKIACNFLSQTKCSRAHYCIRACKNVLCAGSEFFRSLFSSNNEFADANKKEYMLNKVPHVCLKLAVEALHTGEVLAVTDVKVACDLLDTAKYLMLEDLAVACGKFLLKRHLNEADCNILWKTARKYPMMLEFNSKIESYMAQMLTKLMLEDSFLSLSTQELCQIMLILKSMPTETAASADVCFSAVLAWLEHDADNRRSFSDEVLKTISITPGQISRQSLIKAGRSQANVFSESTAKTILGLLACSLEAASVPEKKPDSMTANCFSSSSSHQAVKLYCIGGHTCPDTESNNTEKRFLKYSVQSGHWTENELLPWKRSSCGACIIDDRIVLVGGVKDGVAVSDIDKFWSRYTGCTTTTLPTGLKVSTSETSSTEWLACTVGTAAHRRQVIYVFNGGRLMAYSLHTHELMSKACTYRNEVAMTYSKSFDAIYSAGKRLENSGKSAICFGKYDVGHDTWTDIAEINTHKSHWGKPGLALCGDDLYLTGGGKSDGCRSALKFNIRTGQQIQLPDLPTERPICQAVALYPNVVAVLGSAKCVDVCDVREGKWSTGKIVPDMPIAVSKFGFAWK